jgi:hypothetical protein
MSTTDRQVIDSLFRDVSRRVATRAKELTCGTLRFN